MDTLAFDYVIPAIRAYPGLHPLDNAHAERTKKSRKTLIQYFAALLNLIFQRTDYAFTPLYSSDIVSFLRPLARRAANTRRPFAVAILSRKPCLFLLFLLEGW